jgi:hypothetical protein
MACIHLEAHEIAWLLELDGVHEPQSTIYCELQRNHDGPHAALGQTTVASEDWWVRWTLRASEIVPLARCGAEGDKPDKLGERELCLLFKDHERDHTFQFEVW